MKWIYFAELLGIANMWTPALTKLPCPHSNKRGKKSEGKEAQKGTKLINYYKINDLHTIFTHFAKVDNYTGFFTFFF